MYRNLLIGSLTLAMVAVLAGASLADNQPKRKAPVPKTSKPAAPKKASVRIETPNPGTPSKVVPAPIGVPTKVPIRVTGRPPLQLPPVNLNNPSGPNQPPIRTTSPILTAMPTDMFLILAPTAIVAGNSFSVSVKAIIQVGRFTSFDNSYNGPARLTSSDGQLTPITIQLSQGIGTANIVLTKVGTITLSATAGSVSGQSNILVNPGVAKSLVFLNGPSTLHAKSNVWNQIDLVAFDAYGNIANSDGYAAIQSSAPGVVANPNPVQMQNGEGVFFCEFTQAESVTLTASFSGLVARQTVNVLP
jgi:hypothetical protein